MVSIPKNNKKSNEIFAKLELSILKPSTGKEEKKAVGFKPLTVTSSQDLIMTLNTYHCSLATLKDGKRNDTHVQELAQVIKLDLDTKEDDALGNTLAILDEQGYAYISVPSQSNLDYKRHILVFCAGVYSDANPLKLKAGYVMQVEHFLTETGIDISWLDTRPLFATSGYLAPATCTGNLTIEEANTKSHYHPGSLYPMLDLAGNGIVVPDKPDKRSRSSVKGLAKVEGEKFKIKDVDAGNINILANDNTIYHYGKLVSLQDAVERIKKAGDTNTIYGGFGCPVCNPGHGKDNNLDPRTSPYAFAFISDQGEDVLFKCTGTACQDKPLYKLDDAKEGKPFKIYRVTDHTGSLKMAIFDRKDNTFIKPTSGSKQAVYSLSGGMAKAINMKLVKSDMDERKWKLYLAKCDEVEIIRHGYKKRGFAKAGQGKQIFWDAPIPKFTLKEMEATDIVKRALSMFDKDLTTAGVPNALLILGSYLFGLKQAMAVLALVGDPASAKTFYAQELVKILFGKEWVGSITPDEHNWGDVEYGKRHICYNDVDKMSDLVKRKLTGKVKRRATEGEDGTLNMKGGAIVGSTPTSQSITANYVDAIPIDAEGKDRRIYIPVVNHDYTEDPKELAKAFDPAIGGKQAIQNRKDLICHLYKLWNDAKKEDSKAVQNLLFLSVPMTEEKQDIMSEGLADGKALLNDLSGKDDYNLVVALEPYLELKKAKTLDDISDMIITQRKDAGLHWFLPQELLQELRYQMKVWDEPNEKPNLRQTSMAFLGKKRFNNLSVNGVSDNRGVKIPK